ncbi:MAG: hypothetical protein AAB552_03290 [Patescibacteria group bacterium]
MKLKTKEGKYFAVSIIFFSIVSFLPTTALATIGACAYHNGVNCSTGRDWDGSVICNDGWSDSSVYFSDADECQGSSNSCPWKIDDEATYNQLIKENNDAIARIKARTQTDCEYSFQILESSNNNLYRSCTSAIQSSVRLGGMNMVSTDCDGEKAKRTTANQATKNVCLFGSDDIIFKYQRLNSCMVLDKTDYCTAKFPNTHTEDTGCKCNAGYSFSAVGCTPTPKCPANSFMGTDNQCRCDTGFVVKSGQCVFPVVVPIVIAPKPQPATSDEELFLSNFILPPAKVSQPRVELKAKEKPQIKKETSPRVATTPPIVSTSTTSLHATSSTSTTSPQKQEPKKSWFSTTIQRFFKILGL